MVTVAAVLVISRALANAGIVDQLSAWLAQIGNRMLLQVTTLTALAAVTSAFINNVGALATLMLVTVRMAHQSHRSPSLLLMPLAFGSLLGGLTTLIGTPPHIIIATFRASTGAAPFRMFDFAPVGGVIALAGAQGISASPDPFLMGVAVDVSSAFLTPIGHQSNTLVMGPGGYKFGDYWRMGLPISILVVAVATPLILFFWPAC